MPGTVPELRVCVPRLLSTRSRRVPEAKLQQSAATLLTWTAHSQGREGTDADWPIFLIRRLTADLLHVYTHEKLRTRTDADRILQFPWEHLIFSAGRLVRS